MPGEDVFQWLFPPYETGFPRDVIGDYLDSILKDSYSRRYLKAGVVSC